MDWIAVGVGAIGGIGAFLARRAVAAMDGLEESHHAQKETVAILAHDHARIVEDLDEANERITATQLEVAALKGKLGNLPCQQHGSHPSCDL